MKVMTENNDIAFGNTGNATAFSISASAKAFKVLSSTIYKHKIRAVVRELVCNAVDAHVLNSQTQPFEIKCPTILDPRFIVRDFGPGLSDEDMVELYTTYFASTKADRNDQIGALGLGSKSPFSYTSTFSVVSYFDGMVRVYQCMLSGGEPAIVKTFEEPMNEDDKTGIEVIVPVKPDDVDKFKNMISYIMRPFKSDSYVVKDVEIDIQSFDKLVENSKAEYFNLNTFHDRTSAYAIYGNIVYPLEDVPGINYSWLTSGNKSVYINFDLGLLDIQPSREELSLDEETIKAVVSKVNKLNAKLMNADVESIRGIKNNREVARIIKSMPALKYNILSKEGIKFNDKLIEQVVSGYNFDDMVESLSACSVYDLAYNGIKLRKVVKKPLYRSVRASETIPNKMFDYSKSRAFVIIKDDKKNIRTTIQGWLLDESENSPKTYDFVTVVNPCCPTQVSAIDKIKEVMEQDEVIVLKSSEMEEIRKNVPGYGIKKPKATPSTRPSTSNAILYSVRDNGTYFVSKELYMTAEEIKDYSGYVIGVNRENVCIKNSDWEQVYNLSQQDIRNYMMKKGIESFIVARPSSQRRFGKNDNALCLFDMMYRDYRKAVISVKPKDLRVGISSQFITNIRHIPKLAKFMLGDEVDESLHDYQLCDAMCGIYCYNTKYSKAITRLNSILKEKRLQKKQSFIKNKSILKKLSYSLAYTLENAYVPANHLKMLEKDVDKLI